jgi:oligogalacturonide lyase
VVHRRGRQQPPLRQGAPNGESCTHEFWVPDGSAMVYVSYLKGQPKRWIRALDPVTLKTSADAMPPCSHLMSNHDGTLIVGDGCATPADVADGRGHAIENDDPTCTCST